MPLPALRSVLQKLVSMLVFIAASPGFAHHYPGGDTDLKPVTVQLASEHWPPYIVSNSHGVATTGIIYRFIEEIFADIHGYALSVPIMPYSRAVQEVRAGKHHGLAFCYSGMDSTETMLVSKPITTIPIYAFALKGRKIDLENLARNKKLLVGVRRNFIEKNSVVRSFVSASGSTMVPVRHPEGAFKMLRAGRIDILLHDAKNAEIVIQQLGLEGKVVRSELPSLHQNVQLCLHNSPDMIVLLQQINMHIEMQFTTPEIGMVSNIN